MRSWPIRWKLFAAPRATARTAAKFLIERIAPRPRPLPDAEAYEGRGLRYFVPKLDELAFGVTYGHANQAPLMEQLTALHDRVAARLQWIERERGEAWAAWRSHAAPELR